MKLIKPFLRLSMTLTGSILLASLLGSYFIQHSTQLFSLKALLTKHHWQMAIWRSTAFALIFWYWSEIFRWLGKRRQWSEEVIQHLINQRLRVVTLFILFELVIAQNLFGFLLS